MSKIKIFLADDHAILRESLKIVLSGHDEYEIVGEAGDGRVALEKIEKLKPDIAVLDITMPGMTGVEITRQLKKYNPSVKVIILSRHDGEEYVNQLLELGVNGYVLKDNALDDLKRAISEIMNGNIYLSPQVMTRIFSGKASRVGQQAEARLQTELTAREIETLKLIAEGKTTAEISSILRISENTVKAHRTNIMKKLNIHKVTDLVRHAVKIGLVES